MGDFVIGSPLASALTVRGRPECSWDGPGWRNYLEEGSPSPVSHTSARPFVQLYKYQAAMQNGALLAMRTSIAGRRSAGSRKAVRQQHRPHVRADDPGHHTDTHRL